MPDAGWEVALGAVVGAGALVAVAPAEAAGAVVGLAGAAGVVLVAGLPEEHAAVTAAAAPINPHPRKRRREVVAAMGRGGKITGSLSLPDLSNAQEYDIFNRNATGRTGGNENSVQTATALRIAD